MLTVDEEIRPNKRTENLEFDFSVFLDWWAIRCGELRALLFRVRPFRRQAGKKCRPRDPSQGAFSWEQFLNVGLKTNPRTLDICGKDRRYMWK